MRTKTSCLFALVFALIAISSAYADGWKTYDPGFRALDITNGSSNTLWACGSDASIAVSSDSGSHWTIRDQNKNAGLLLTIRFRGQFGYAVGTTGYIAFSQNAGETWQHTAIPYRDALSGSFSDATHGLIRTRGEILATADGKTWSSISEKYASNFAKFPYVMAIAALDEKHMAVHISEPPPSRSGFLYTKDAGTNWNFLEIPNVTITSLLIQGNMYWAVGTEVIHKDQPGGGHAVPLALYSADGEHWEHTQHDIEMCHWEGCGGTCTDQGCFAASGLIMNIFQEKVDRIVFPPNPGLTVKWATTPTAVCFVGSQLECADARVDATADAKNMAGEHPTSDAQSLKKPASTSGVQCLVCGLQSIYVDAKASGNYALKTTLLINRNGLIESVDIQNAPSKTLEESLRHSMMGWVFLPTLQDSTPINVKLNATVNVRAIRPN